MAPGCGRCIVRICHISDGIRDKSVGKTGDACQPGVLPPDRPAPGARAGRNAPNPSARTSLGRSDRGGISWASRSRTSVPVRAGRTRRQSARSSRPDGGARSPVLRAAVPTGGLAFQAVGAVRVGGVTTCAARSAARAGLETGVPSSERHRVDPETGVPNRAAVRVGGVTTCAARSRACRSVVGGFRPLRRRCRPEAGTPGPVPGGTGYAPLRRRAANSTPARATGHITSRRQGLLIRGSRRSGKIGVSAPSRGQFAGSSGLPWTVFVSTLAHVSSPIM